MKEKQKEPEVLEEKQTEPEVIKEKEKEPEVIPIEEVDMDYISETKIILQHESMHTENIDEFKNTKVVTSSQNVYINHIHTINT